MVAAVAAQLISRAQQAQAEQVAVEQVQECKAAQVQQELLTQAAAVVVQIHFQMHKLVLMVVQV
jgi:hypothetical protein